MYFSKRILLAFFYPLIFSLRENCHARIFAQNKENTWQEKNLKVYIFSGKVPFYGQAIAKVKRTYCEKLNT